MPHRSFNKIIKIIGLVSALTLLSSCGGGDDDDADTPAPPVPITGKFLDSPVEGLTYQSGSNPPGKTDANGTFVYHRGKSLTFTVGGVEVGTLPDGAAVITPIDFGLAATNIARFLQTLDTDSDPSNGIDITAAAVALIDTPLDDSVFLSDTTSFERDIGPVLEVVFGSGAFLVDEATALAHLVSENVRLLNPGELVAVGPSPYFLA